MSTITVPVTTVEPGEDARTPDQTELAAVAFLARYSGRTLDAYRHDLRNLFQWAADHGLAVLEGTRAHLEMYRAEWTAPITRLHPPITLPDQITALVDPLSDDSAAWSAWSVR